MNAARDGLAHSVQVRLARHAKEINVDPNLVLTRYGIERFLYRLSRSAHAERFVLKGALLLIAWLGETLRPTRDADLLGFGDFADDELARIMRDVCEIEVEPDAVIFDAESIVIDAIRAEDTYGGRRATLTARLGAARLRIQVDIGIGDAVTPAAQWLQYPSLLDLPQPRLRAYPRETVVAEKLHAIVSLGMRNSRLKDYFDLHALACEGAMESARLGEAIAATFARRNTAVPVGLPTGLTPAFSLDREKAAQWKAFLTRNRLEGPALEDVVQELGDFIIGPLVAARSL
ncbi:MAG: nucleotidyl transferase AbiEii/AbiGii toxin family protein [Pseudomonadota bacterium]